VGLEQIRDSLMADWKEQDIYVKVCFDFGATASRRHNMLESAKGENARGITRNFEWLSSFIHTVGKLGSGS